MAPGPARPGAGGKRCGDTVGLLTVLQLVLVASLLASQLPTLLKRFGSRHGGSSGASSLLPRRGAGRGLKGGLPAVTAAPVNTVWEPQCVLPDDLMPNHGNYTFVDIAVLTEIGARSRRDAIRAGWAAYARSLDMRVRFFVGEAEPGDVHGRASRDSEAREFNDLVVLPMVDTYENLTLKTLGMATYSAKCGNGKYYVKTDDDVFVYPWRLAKRLEKLEYELPLYGSLGVYMGNFWIDSKPIRVEGNKNYEPRWKSEHYGPYAAGPFYILSRGAVEYVADNARRLNWKWRNEDMAMGTWLMGADVEYLNEWAIKILNWKHYEKPLIAEHNIDDRERMDEWHTELARNFSRPDPSPTPPPPPPAADTPVA